MRLRTLIILTTTLLLVAACGGGDDTTTTAGGDATTTAPAGSAENEVVIRDITFNPTEITVQAGATVTWNNEDGVSHTSTSEDDLWNSEAISPGGQFTFTFDEPGTYTYFCSFHGTMQATVIVEG